jgi:glycosyltransferase 2 family protein
MTRGQRVSQVVQIAFTVLVIAFIAIYLSRIDWTSLEGLSLSPAPLIASCLIALAYRYWGAFIWLYLLVQLGAKSIGRFWVELSYVYAKSWLGRYLLGAGTWILGKLYFAAQHGVPKSKLAVSGVLEGVLQLVATLVVGLALLVFDPRLGALGVGAVTVAAIALAACVVALIPPVFRFGIGLAFRIVRRKRIAREDLPSGRSILVGGSLYVIGTFISGSAYFFVVQAVYPAVRWTDFIYIVGASSVAAAVSLLAVFAPGGIGVREGVQVAFFSALMPTEIAVVIAVLMRLWSLAIDVLFFATAALILRLRAPRIQQTEE